VCGDSIGITGQIHAHSFFNHNTKERNNMDAKEIEAIKRTGSFNALAEEFNKQGNIIAMSARSMNNQNYKTTIQSIMERCEAIERLGAEIEKMSMGGAE
jgi:hypothetical protein